MMLCSAYSNVCSLNHKKIKIQQMDFLTLLYEGFHIHNDCYPYSKCLLEDFGHLRD